MDKKKIAIALIPIIIFSLVGLHYTEPIVKGDLKGHFYKATGNCDEVVGWVACEKYPGLYHFVFGFFTSSEELFYYANFVFFFIIFPLAVWLVSGNEFYPLVYSMGTSFSHWILRNGHATSSVMMLFLVFFLYIKELFESVVSLAWKEEKMFHNKVFGKTIQKTEDICQGLSRIINHKLSGCFPNPLMLEFEVKGKKHIVVYVVHNLVSYVIDGTIKQFLPEEERTVFYREDYPFKTELNHSTRRLI